METQPTTACRWSRAKCGAQRRFSLSPVPGRAQKAKLNTPAGRSPGACSTSGRSGDPHTRECSYWNASQSTDTAATVAANSGGTAKASSAQGVSAGGSVISSSAVGGVRAVVTADYNGEIKVFLGFGEAPL